MSKQSLNIELSEMTEENGEEPTVLPPTYLVLQLNPDTPSSALKWLVDKIKGQRRDGGAELVLLKQPTRDNEPLYLHVSASRIKFLEAAEEMEMVKMDKNGKMREFSVAQLEEFLPDGMMVEDLLTLSERQMIVMHELDNIRALAEDDHIPGYPSYTLYEGQSVMNVCQDCNIIYKVYSLHDRDELKKLGRKWYLSVFRKQPFEEIRMYFGEAIALYFTFLGFYTTALIIPMTLGFLQLLLSTETVAFFCIFNVVWMTVFLELWRRKSNELAFKWGTIGMTSLDEPRSNYRGEMGIDPVTGRIQPQYPRWKTNVKVNHTLSVNVFS
ncbi:ngep-related [Holotrichia oblita]|uniref:Ngep-related n=1 Tax=Holotrichia oblita TaxID=644536 RepID=A0ACB9TDJ1_HOLOL|nr:ngep-related [Holotrichia oblita]